MASNLKKELGLYEVFAIASGAMISSGIFVLPGIAYSQAGPSIIVSYFLAGLIALTGALSQSELVSAMPKAGGTYFYVVRSLGPAIGTIDGFISWFSLSLKTSFALIGLAAFLEIALRGNLFFSINAVAILFCVLFLFLNLLGVKNASRFQNILVSVLIFLLMLYVVLGLKSIKVSHFEPFNPKGLSSVFSTAGFVFVSYGGLLKVASIAEEVRNPGKIIPKGILMSLGLMMMIYTIVVFVTVGVLSPEKINGSLTPISDGAVVFWGSTGKWFLETAGFLAFITTANAGIMAASRYPYALSKDGFLPILFSKVNKKGVPYISLLATAFAIIGSLFLPLKILVKFASSVMILTFILSNLSVIILRESKIQNYRPEFKSPFYPWVQIIGILSFGFILFEMGKWAVFMVIVIILAGFLIYGFFGRRAYKEFALLHLVERITNKQIAGNILEEELKNIIRERDGIVKDRFDKLVEEAVVLDLEGNLSIDEFFKIVAEKFSCSLEMRSKDFFSLLMEREKESSTALNDFLAVPHIIVDGKKVFGLLIARVKKGVKFSKENKSVKAVFVLAGSKDERTFHLQVLAAIAQIVQNPNFEKMWISAKDESALRDIILLGKRKRIN